MREPPAFCPACGTRVPPDARACPECGSDESTGWSDDAHAENLGVPSDKFDYDEFVEEEFSVKKSDRHKLQWYWWFVAVGLLLLFLKFVVGK